MKRLMISSVVMILFAAGCGQQVRDLRCEYQTNPVGIDTPRPRLFWQLQTPDDTHGQRQTAYQVMVASNESLLKQNQPDLWNSGKVTSSESVHIPYAGKPLLSDTTCYWKVRTWDKDGKASSWSEPASWSMGLLEKSDWKAQWIGPVPKTDGSPTPCRYSENPLPCENRFSGPWFTLQAWAIMNCRSTAKRLATSSSPSPGPNLKNHLL